MSNENYIHHENWGKVGKKSMGGLACTPIGMWYIILQVTNIGEFENHIVVLKFKEKLRSLKPTENLKFSHKLQEKRAVSNFCRSGSKNLLF